MIKVGSRNSLLARKQVEEVFNELGPDASFEFTGVKTTGDCDLKSSLREKDKTDFFTREVDELLLQGKCRIGIHSAKDLPDPLPKGLKLIALTSGQDPSDSLVFRERDRLDTLRKGAYIGSSSKRRDRIVKTLRPDLLCVEVRGTIESRLEKLDNKEIDGLIVAEAALIRLGLNHLNRIPLPGRAAPLQGKLAILSRENDEEMERLFAPLDTRQKKRNVLYLGLDPNHFKAEGELIHCPLIEIIPRDFDDHSIRNAFDDLLRYTHLIFTSKTGVKVFFDFLAHYGYRPEDLEGKAVLTVGKSTARAAENYGIAHIEIAEEETQEGIVKLLAVKDLDDAYIFIPCSALARPILANFLMINRIRHQVCPIYDTRARMPDQKPNLDEVDEIVFTSPSTVDAFKKIFGQIPENKKITTIGPITKSRVDLLDYKPD